MSDQIARGQQLLSNNYGPAQLELVRGEGCYVWDGDGNEYLDFLAGIAVNALGHAHPALVSAISDQVATLAHVSNFFVTPPELALAEKLLSLADATDIGRVLFVNSGAEANEAALKMVRLHAKDKNKPRVLALEGGFHGRTMGSLSLTANAAYREPFEPLPTGVQHIEPTEEALREAMGEDIAALFLEPIQGEAGVMPLPDGFLALARQITEEADALLVIDEVQTGIGRLGDWFGYKNAGITPDIVTLAKGLGGGLPIGACLTLTKKANLFYPGSHGTTYGGNPLVTRGALAVIETIENEGLLENAAVQGQRLREVITALNHPLIEGVRGRGLLTAVTLTKDVAPDVVALARANGLIINAPRPNVVRLAPPLIVGARQIAQFEAKFSTTLDSVSEA